MNGAKIIAGSVSSILEAEVSRKKIIWFVPVTPGGTPLPHLADISEAIAIKNLLKDAAHMPYKTWENFQKRGYTIEQWDTLP